jgi:hypothetical protein
VSGEPRYSQVAPHLPSRKTTSACVQEGAPHLQGLPQYCLGICSDWGRDLPGLLYHAFPPKLIQGGGGREG